MIGIDGFGFMLIALALSLMTVSPLHLTIARSKVKAVAITALHDDRDAEPPADVGDDDDALIAATEQIARIYDQA